MAQQLCFGDSVLLLGSSGNHRTGFYSPRGLAPLDVSGAALLACVCVVEPAVATGAAARLRDARDDDVSALQAGAKLEQADNAKRVEVSAH
jgi:hypothetical protein